MNSKISVNIHHNNLIKSEESVVVFDRKVTLETEDSKIWCTASSSITVTDKDILDLIIHKNIGIGQLFRYLNRLPKFTLIKISKTTLDFSREYLLEMDGLSCHIHEVFPIELYLANHNLCKCAQ